MKTIDHTNILGIGISTINMGLALQQIDTWIRNHDRQYVCVTGVHGVIESYRNKSLQEIHNRAGLVTPDGMPMVWICHVQGYKHVSRVYGPDLLLAACERSIQSGWTHYLYGGSEETINKLASNLSKRFPGLKIAGMYAPPFRNLTAAEKIEINELINFSGADILWVGLGTPKQEYWMAEHINQINVPVMIGVGAAFDFHAGIKKQAPFWMQRSGLEWLYRLINEPRRLWKRYLINNPLFIALILLQMTGIKKFPIK